MKDWLTTGLIVHSLYRWVPPEAVVREFHRAGLAGHISSISLAHRTSLFKFESSAARDAVLNRPWVVNGQPLAAAAWHPDFLPADDAVRYALLWIRLPNLPMEYWSEETLRSMLSVAGEFVAVDLFTKERHRGGFARACVRVNLCQPLRLGARFRASGFPFWQQFVYEHVEGICGHCGSLHLDGPCSSSLAPAASSTPPRFGPWMAALQHRKPSTALPPGNRASSADRRENVNRESQIGEDEWLTPRKFARRKGGPGVPGPCRVVPTAPVPGASADATKTVPVDSVSATKTKRTVKEPRNTHLKGQEPCHDSVFTFAAVASTALSESGSKEKVACNPFALLGSDRLVGRAKIREDANPGSPKRARDEEHVAPKVNSKGVKGKSRVSLSMLGQVGNVTSHPAIGPALLGDDDHNGDPGSPALDH